MKLCTMVLIVTTSVGLLLVSGCETQAQNKALLGGAIGAGAGQLIGRDTEATLIGAGIGAGAGYLWGNMEDNKKEEQAQAQAQARAQTVENDANTTTMWITNSNGSKTPVKLTRTASGGYIGPRGEIYDTLPTEEQLKKVYGF